MAEYTMVGKEAIIGIQSARTSILNRKQESIDRPKLCRGELGFVCWHSGILGECCIPMALKWPTQQSMSLICQGMSAEQHETFSSERQFEILRKNEKSLDVNRYSHTSLTDLISTTRCLAHVCTFSCE